MFKPSLSHAGKWQISATGGNEPVWSRDGKELFYLDLDGKLMEVDVNTNATFQAAIPKPLFQTQLNGRYPGRTMYVVSPDAQRFLMIVPAGTVQTRAPNGGRELAGAIEEVAVGGGARGSQTGGMDAARTAGLETSATMIAIPCRGWAG